MTKQFGVKLFAGHTFLTDVTTPGSSSRRVFDIFCVPLSSLYLPTSLPSINEITIETNLKNKSVPINLRMGKFETDTS